MDIRIIPLAFDPVHNFRVPIAENTKELSEKSDPKASSWGIYLGDKQVFSAASKELAEKVKLWMEIWLQDRT